MATDSIRQIAAGLLTLEVNTVVKDGITAQKMPAMGHALLDIADSYQIYLCERYGDLAGLTGLPDWPAEIGPAAGQVAIGGRPAVALSQWEATIDGGSFALLYRLADYVLTARDLVRQAAGHSRDRVLIGIADRLTADQDVLLRRIKRNSSQICGLFDRLAGDRQVKAGQTGPDRAALRSVTSSGAGDDVLLKLTPNDELILRKIWEVGTEVVVMQTVIQLDGDVVQRVVAGRANDPALHSLHQAAVGIATDRWNSLFQIVASLGSTLAGAVGDIFRR